ncbi:LysR substrate-binding domain-containing protein [Catenulispora yoronensis]|uniref:LysR substrate-binding domain-containing protein n=1 Tax=Catenulispora yoronensis TaxID=450799 RepID=A0ABP5FE27_9ACTN
MIEIELRHLRSFQAVVAESSISKAAARLHLTQQGVSQHLQHLERALGVTLLVRTPRGVSLTAAGELLVAGAAPLLSGLDDLALAVRAIGGERRGRIRLVSAAFTVTQLSIELAKSLEAAHPGVEVDVATAQRPIEAMRMMLEGRADASLMWLPTGEERLVAVPVRSDPRVVLMSERHRLADRAAVTLADLAEEPVVIVDAFASPQALAHRIVDPRPDGRPAVRGPVVETLEECLTQVRRGHGVWFAPRAMAEWAVCGGVRLVPVTDIPPTPLAVVWPAAAPRGLVELLVEHVRERIAEF